MRSWINLFLLFSILVLFLNPKNMRILLLSASSETKLFELRSLPHGYLTLLGDSHLRGGTIILTKEGMPTDVPRSAGVVLYRRPILFQDPKSKRVSSFNTMIAFSIENMYGDKQAFGDGLAFLISPDDDLLGSPGYLGLVDSTNLTKNKFIAIEFDTKYDSRFKDPDDNHVGLDINNLISVKLATSSFLGVNLKNGDVLCTWINYKSNRKRLEVFLSGSSLKPKKPILKVDIDLTNHLKDKMFVGLSAATEGSMHLIRIHRWEFTAVDCSPPPPPPSPPEPGITFPNPSKSGHRHGHLSWFAIGLIVGMCSVPFTLLFGWFGWFGWKKLTGIIQKSEGTNNLELQTIKSSSVGISRHKVELSIFVDEVARALSVEKMLDNVAELIRLKTVKSRIPHCNNLPAVEANILPQWNGLPPRTNDTTSVR